MSGDELTHVEAVFVVTEGIVEVLGDLKPTDEEDESENEEERDVGGDVGFIHPALASDEREEEVTPESEPHHLSVKRGQDHTVESVHILQLSLKFGNLVDQNLLFRRNDFVFFGSEYEIIRETQFGDMQVTRSPFNHGHTPGQRDPPDSPEMILRTHVGLQDV